MFTLSRTLIDKYFDKKSLSDKSQNLLNFTSLLTRNDQKSINVHQNVELIVEALQLTYYKIQVVDSK